MKILINQRFGIGDCVYIMTIAKRWMAEGHSITWPVFPQFVEQLRRAYPFIKWLDWTTVNADYNRREEHDWNGFRVVPIAWSNEIMGEPYTNCMRNKYDLLQLDYRDWREGAMWNDSMGKQLELFNILGANMAPYRVRNEIYSSEANMRVSIPSATKLLTINMNPIDGYSLFDWVLILIGASEIHTVSTSIIYLLEMLDIQCPIHLYPRPTDPHFKQVDYLFTKPYILH